MRLVAFALAVLLSMVTMVWVAASSYRRFIEKDEVGTTLPEGVGLVLVVTYALGAIFALTQPSFAIGAFVLCGMLGIGAGLLLEVSDLVTVGAGAILPAAGSLLSGRQLR